MVLLSGNSFHMFYVFYFLIHLVFVDLTGLYVSHLDENEYKRMYPTGLRRGLVYTKPKMHKLQRGEGLNELTMRPIISNIGTGTYETAKFLNSLLAS